MLSDTSVKEGNYKLYPEQGILFKSINYIEGKKSGWWISKAEDGKWGIHFS